MLMGNNFDPRDCSCCPSDFRQLKEYIPAASVLCPLSSPRFDEASRFLSSSFNNLGLKDFLIFPFPLCEENDSEILEGCLKTAAFVFFSASPKIIAPCGRLACSLFGLDFNDREIYETFYVSRGKKGKSPPVIVMPLYDPLPLMRDTGDNTAKYLAFSDRINMTRSLSVMCGTEIPDENFLESLNIEWKPLFS